MSYNAQVPTDGYAENIWDTVVSANKTTINDEEYDHSDIYFNWSVTESPYNHRGSDLFNYTQVELKTGGSTNTFKVLGYDSLGHTGPIKHIGQDMDEIINAKLHKNHVFE